MIALSLSTQEQSGISIGHRRRFKKSKLQASFYIHMIHNSSRIKPMGKKGKVFCQTVVQQTLLHSLQNFPCGVITKI